ncbi:MAG: flagellar basal body-associated FliL family protein [Desulfovibrionaceae bacterium]
MLFIVPDLDDDLSPEPSGDKAQLDTDELSSPAGGVAMGGDKVELDLEDAPFLEEEEEEEASPLAVEDADAADGGEPTGWRALIRNRKFQIAAGGGLLLLLLGLGAFLYFHSGEKPAEDAAQEQPAEKDEATAQDAAKPEKEPEKKDFIVAWDRFWVEHRTEDGQIRFLICKFSAPTTDEKLAWEIRSKKVTLRDSVFYYLRNKDLTFLSDKKNVDLLKKDLLGVINQYLTNGQLEELLIEEYLVK